MKNILLIGGSYGMGLAIAKELHQGNRVFVASRTNENLGDLNVTHLPFDALTDTIDTSQLPEVIDGLVYCPGSINLRPFARISDAEFLNDFEINVMGAIRAIRQSINALKK